jgi:predicted NAD/FAD-binding protein
MSKIAVIGSGIAGLSATWLLSKEGKNQVTVYERAKRLGMDAHGLTVDLKALRT